MREDGLLVQRVKVHAGRIKPPQLRALGELARRCTPEYPLHLTTRQGFELHGVRPEDVPRIQKRVAEVGLTTVGACGDSLRNVTTCPGSGLCPDSRDMLPLADEIRKAGEALPFIRSMPRKFKISISGCERACARPWIADLGLVCREDGAFQAIGAGSLGARPGAGIPLYDRLPAEQLVSLVRAALTLFNAEGDRKIRSRARFRHVRERLGNETFKQRLDKAFKQELPSEGSGATAGPAFAAEAASAEQVPARPCESERQGNAVRELARVRPPLGDVTPDLAVELADAVEAAGATIRLGLEHEVVLYGSQEISLSPALQQFADGPAMTSCPGTTWCKRGIADSRAAELSIREILTNGKDRNICISGCPNNCAHAAVADIGLTGRTRKIGGETVAGFRLLAGGDGGRSPKLAGEVAAFVAADGVAAAVARLVAEGRSDDETGGA
jgi:sulfite reductase beta subunit-like hemoprotein